LIVRFSALGARLVKWKWSRQGTKFVSIFTVLAVVIPLPLQSILSSNAFIHPSISVVCFCHVFRRVRFVLYSAYSSFSVSVCSNFPTPFLQMVLTIGGYNCVMSITAFRPNSLCLIPFVIIVLFRFRNLLFFIIVLFRYFPHIHQPFCK
jgi:hypothetical protein